MSDGSPVPSAAPATVRNRRAAPHPSEPHAAGLAGRLNWLRAGVLGANDGIVSVAGLVIGVAGATTAPGPIFTAGLAGLVAGAVSMALGEYVSVSSQRDSETAQLAQERSRRSCASCAVSLSRWLLTDTYSPSAIDTAPATRPASPAVKMGPRAVVAPATPITRPATETIPSLAPSTPARNQFSRPARPAACGSLGWGAARRFLTVAGAADGTGEPSLMPQVNQREWTACRGAQADLSLSVAEPTRADRVAVAVAGQRASGTPSIPLSSWSIDGAPPFPRQRRKPDAAPRPAPRLQSRCGRLR